jgi:hypothetical protein
VQSELLPCDYSTVSIDKNNVELDEVLIKTPIDNNIEIRVSDLSLLSLSGIAIYDNLGKLICQQNKLTGKNYMIDFSYKCNGVYYVKILLNNNQILVKKIIKQ